MGAGSAVSGAAAASHGGLDRRKRRGAEQGGTQHPGPAGGAFVATPARPARPASAAGRRPPRPSHWRPGRTRRPPWRRREPAGQRSGGAARRRGGDGRRRTPPSLSFLSPARAASARGPAPARAAPAAAAAAAAEVAQLANMGSEISSVAAVMGAITLVVRAGGWGVAWGWGRGNRSLFTFFSDRRPPLSPPSPLQGLAVGFVLLRIESYVEENEA